MQSVEPYKGPEPIVKAFLSWQCLAAAVCMYFFWTTITAYDAERKSPDGGKGGVHQQSIGDGPEVIVQANQMKPVLLAKENKAAEAMQAADDLVRKKSHDVLTIIAAGNAHFLSGAKDNGLRLLKKSVALAPRNRYVRFNYAERLAEAGNYDEAINQYGLLSKSFPKWDEPHLRTADIYLKQDRNADAATALAAVLQLDENNSQARKMRGLALARSGQTMKGMDEYVLGVNMEMQHGLPESLKGLVADWGTVDRTIYEMTQQVNNRPDDYMPKLRLAQLYAYTGNPREAKDHLFEARRLSPSNPEIHRTLAVVMKKLGENNQAMSEFMLSVALEKAANAQAKNK